MANFLKAFDACAHTDKKVYGMKWYTSMVYKEDRRCTRQCTTIPVSNPYQHMLKKIGLTVALCISMSCALANDALNTYGIVLLQPDNILQERVPNVEALSTYIGGIESAVSKSVQARPTFAPTSGFIVVAIKPGNKSNVWLDFAPALKPEDAAAVRAAARSVLTAPVKNGVVVFALSVGLWGGQKPTPMAPSPVEWRDAARLAGRPLETGALVESIWTD